MQRTQESLFSSLKLETETFSYKWKHQQEEDTTRWGRVSVIRPLRGLLDYPPFPPFPIFIGPRPSSVGVFQKLTQGTRPKSDDDVKLVQLRSVPGPTVPVERPLDTGGFRECLYSNTKVRTNGRLRGFTSSYFSDRGALLSFSPSLNFHSSGSL